MRAVLAKSAQHTAVVSLAGPRPTPPASCTHQARLRGVQPDGLALLPVDRKVSRGLEVVQVDQVERHLVPGCGTSAARRHAGQVSTYARLQSHITPLLLLHLLLPECTGPVALRMGRAGACAGVSAAAVTVWPWPHRPRSCPSARPTLSVHDHKRTRWLAEAAGALILVQVALTRLATDFTGRTLLCVSDTGG